MLWKIIFENKSYYLIYITCHFVLSFISFGLTTPKVHNCMEIVYVLYLYDYILNLNIYFTLI